IGTFALAMAFAGNDLVNFIGVPLAGYSSYKSWAAAGNIAPESFSMESLAGEVSTPTFLLIISGLIMILTLILSKKAQSVINTSVDLSRQAEGGERFGSSLIARLMVRSTINFNKSVTRLMPVSVNNAIAQRFAPIPLGPADHPDTPAFDKIRASVNLLVASILIALGTSLKLPLSTTYVTFMVAMGTSFADRAWDRDSAVYRVSGVFHVIGGWFATALAAFITAFAVAAFLYFGEVYAFVAILILLGISLYRSNKI